jgi:Type I restriction enzyme R protein N terminus (HSDR_N)
MVNILTISEDITNLRQVEEKLGLTLSEDRHFFTEWMDDLAELTELEKARLEQIRKNYLYQISDGYLLEETIKMIILSPLLELAGFYQTPYKFRAEVSVEVQTQGDDDEILRGRIDALVLQNKLWIILIEAKKTTFDLELAIPQTLAYMSANPQVEKSLTEKSLTDKPVFGMVTNGSSYLFIKTKGKQYGISDLFSTRSPYQNNLNQVIKILKHLGTLII